MSVVELGGLLKSMAIHLSLKERQAVLAVVDLSGDGELDFPEFLRLISLIRKEETKAVLEEGKKQAKKFDLDFDPGFMNKPSFPAQGFTKILQTVKLSDSALDEYIVSRNDGHLEIRQPKRQAEESFDKFECQSNLKSISQTFFLRRCFNCLQRRFSSFCRH